MVIVCAVLALLTLVRSNHYPLRLALRVHRAAAAVTAAAAAAAAEAAESRARQVLSESEGSMNRLKKQREEELAVARRTAREEVARAKEEADMTVEEERSRALKEVTTIPFHSFPVLFVLVSGCLSSYACCILQV